MDFFRHIKQGHKTRLQDEKSGEIKTKMHLLNSLEFTHVNMFGKEGYVLPT